MHNHKLHFIKKRIPRSAGMQGPFVALATLQTLALPII